MVDFDPMQYGILPLPFTGEPFLTKHVGQTQRLKAQCQILINGVDVTKRLNPYLINVHVEWLINPGYPEATIELDDRDGQLPIPKIGSTVHIFLGWENEELVGVFTNGKTFDVEHGFGRDQGGRRMWVHAQGLDFATTHLKSPHMNSVGDGAPPGEKEGKKIPLLAAVQELATGKTGK